MTFHIYFPCYICLVFAGSSACLSQQYWDLKNDLGSLNGPPGCMTQPSCSWASATSYSCCCCAVCDWLAMPGIPWELVGGWGSNDTEGNIDLSFVYVCVTATQHAHMHSMAKVNLLDCVDLCVLSGNKVSSFVFRLSEREGCRPLCDSVNIKDET